MTVALIQTLLCACAAFGVYRLWRSVSGISRPIFWLITAGVLVRAVAGQVAFWVSDLHLPLARSLQVGRGLWIFAVDAMGYFDVAAAAAHHGPAAILFLSRTIGSVFYVQVLATALLLFGTVTSVAILLNIAAYLGTCLMALYLAGSPRNPNRTVIVSIAILSLSPSVLMWSVQPLKDTVFLFLVAAFFAVAYHWQEVWRRSATLPQRAAVVGVSALLAGLMYAIAAIRWYFAFAIVLAMIPFALVAVLRAQRRIAAAGTAVVLIPLLAAMLFAGAGPYVPTSLRPSQLVNPARSPQTLLTEVDEARTRFDKSAGATMIGAGDTIQKVDAHLGVKETRVAATRPPDVIYQRARPGEIKVGMYAQQIEKLQKLTASASGAAPAEAAAEPAGHETDEGRLPGATVAVPASPVTRLIAGIAALTLPRAVAQRLGLLKVGGGRGLWAFVEVDTVFFDFVLLFAVSGVIRAIRRGGFRVPVFWLVLLVTGTIAIALAYTVSNFGTLFRHRDMVLLGLALLPLAVSALAPMEARAAKEHESWRADAPEPLHA